MIVPSAGGKDIGTMADTNVTVNETVNETANETVKNDSTSKFEIVLPAGKLETVATSKNTDTLEVKPLSQTSSETLEVKPLSQTLDLRPVKTDALSTLDLKPVALDLCVRTGQASIPPVHVCEPYRHRVELTVLGIELFGLAWSGDSQTIVDDRRSQPAIVWGETVAAPHRHLGPPKLEHEDYPHHHHDRGGRERGGLRIRLAD